MKVEFVASVSAIVADAQAAQRLFGDALGIPLDGGEGEYKFTELLPGLKHFGLWPLEDAAKACFGEEEWPPDLPIPQASIEFEVLDVAAAAAELQSHGFHLLHGAKTEPWTQITARLLSSDGLLVGVCYTPWFHTEAPEG